MHVSPLLFVVSALIIVFVASFVVSYVQNPGSDFGSVLGGFIFPSCRAYPRCPVGSIVDTRTCRCVPSTTTITRTTVPPRPPTTITRTTTTTTSCTKDADCPQIMCAPCPPPPSICPACPKYVCINGKCILSYPTTTTITRTTTTSPTCKNLCGDGICQKIVCTAIGCPCLETSTNCPRDCGSITTTITPTITKLPN